MKKLLVCLHLVSIGVRQLSEFWSDKHWPRWWHHGESLGVGQPTSHCGNCLTWFYAFW